MKHPIIVSKLFKSLLLKRFSLNLTKKCSEAERKFLQNFRVVSVDGI
ncbi:unnamed protein product [Larinioides sclopetarius]|uniref:Uncharacterized protein n=1 Tax=Larinioides sclopetarius TaxID=280406 RepID=A0AAV2BWQ7_9ARAC